MYDLCEDDWEAIFLSDSDMDEEDDIMGVSIATTIAGPLAQDRLIIGYAILALFQTLTTMILQKQIVRWNQGSWCADIYLGILERKCSATYIPRAWGSLYLGVMGET